MPAFIGPLSRNINDKKLVLAGFTMLVFVHIVFTFSGFYGSDDINYARYAAGIVNNGIPGAPPTHHFQLRWSTIYATAFFYSILGINAFSSTLCSALSFIICGLILHKILARESTTVFMLSMTLFFFAHSIIFYMHRLQPDAVMGLAVLWMYYCYRTSSLSPRNPVLYGLSFATALFLGAITKETIIIALPLFFVLFCRDLFKRRQMVFWQSGIGFSILFVFLYLLFFKITTGDFLFRYHLLVSKAYDNICSFDTLPFIYTLKRIGFELWKAMLLNGDFLVFIPALTAAIYKNKIGQTGLQKTDVFSFLFLLVSTNFMTISFTDYVPLCHDPRHFIFLFPFAAILGGPMLFAYFKDPSKFLYLPLMFIIATGIMFMLHAGTTKYLYLLLALLFSACYIVSRAGMRKDVNKVAIVIFIGIMSLNYLVDFFKPLYGFYWDHKKIVETNFSNNSTAATVFCSDELSAELSELFLGFETGDVKFSPASSIKTSNEGVLYYLLNGEINPRAKLKADSLTHTQYAPGIILIDKVKNVSLYQVNSTILQMIKD